MRAGALTQVSCTFSCLSTCCAASITKSEAAPSGQAQRMPCWCSPVRKSFSGAITIQQQSELAGHCILPEQSQPPLCSWLQPASPVWSQSWEHWSYRGIFCPKCRAFGQRQSSLERQSGLCAYRGNAFCNPVARSCPKTGN